MRGNLWVISAFSCLQLTSSKSRVTCLLQIVGQHGQYLLNDTRESSRDDVTEYLFSFFFCSIARPTLDPTPRTCRPFAATWTESSSLTTRRALTDASPTMQYQSVAGSRIPWTFRCSLSFPCLTRCVSPTTCVQCSHATFICIGFGSRCSIVIRAGTPPLSMSTNQNPQHFEFNVTSLGRAPNLIK